MKKTINARTLLPALALLISLPGCAAQVCDYQFQTDDSKAYDTAGLPAFLESEVRSRLNRVSNTFDVHLLRQCSNNGKSSRDRFSLGMETDSLYIKTINGEKLADDVVKYTDAPLTISKASYTQAYSNALKFNTLNKEQKQLTLKMFAFVIAESARFSDVEQATYTAFTRDCSYQWNDYSNLLRHWKTLSIFANTRGIARGPQYIGGTRAFLIAPITNDMRLQFNDAVSNGWEVTRYNYDQRQTDKPISIGLASCN